MKVTDEMVNRFLSWPVPKDFGPDCGITFTPINHPDVWPIGTNLLTADQARRMLEHVLAPAPEEQAQLAKDAARYRWMRAHEWNHPVVKLGYDDWVNAQGEELDTAVDKQMLVGGE